MRRFLTILLIALNILTSVTMLVSAYGGHVNPATTTIPGLMLMMFPAVLVTMILFLIIDLIFKPKLALIAGFTILLSAPAIWNICPLNFFRQSPREGERVIKVMSYNVYNFYDMLPGDLPDSLNSSIHEIIEVDPDIVCLQESAFGTDPGKWSKYRSQADTIVQRFPYRLVNPDMMIWSKYPLTPVEIAEAPDPTAHFMVADVDIDGYPLTVFSLHLQSFGLTPDDKSLYLELTKGQAFGAQVEAHATGIIHKLSAAMRLRAAQASLLRSQIDSLARPNVLIAGDFNDISDCWAQRTIMGRDIHSTFTAVGCGPTITYHANRFFFNIDHMLYGGDIRPLHISWGRRRSSDHYPLISTYAIPAHD